MRRREARTGDDEGLTRLTRQRCRDRFATQIVFATALAGLVPHSNDGHLMRRQAAYRCQRRRQIDERPREYVCRMLRSGHQTLRPSMGRVDERATRQRLSEYLGG